MKSEQKGGTQYTSLLELGRSTMSLYVNAVLFICMRVWDRGVVCYCRYRDLAVLKIIIINTPRMRNVQRQYYKSTDIDNSLQLYHKSVQKSFCMSEVSNC